MAEKQVKILPRYINLDASYETLTPIESPFIKSYVWDINSNGQLGTGTGNPSGEGQNEYTLTPTRSNVKIPDVVKPQGFNKCIGAFESINTKEVFYFNFNDRDNHGIYSVSGDDLLWTKIIIDPKLNFNEDAEQFIAEHRVRLRIRYDENRNVIEKHLIWTDGKEWQGWVNVIAAILTDGFNEALFPYWRLRPPHFDREEYLQYPVRPPMVAPTSVLVENDDTDATKPNKLLDTAFEFSTQFINTDGRETTTSPISLPLIVRTKDFISGANSVPRKAILTLDAGSALTEKQNLYYRFTITKKDEAGSEFLTWSDWYLYDTLYRFTNCDANSPEIIGNKYWLRTGEWDGYDFDVTFNTIKYTFDNTLLGQIIDQQTVIRFFNDIPIASIGLSDLGDAIILANNKYGYDNFSCNVTDNLSVSVGEKGSAACTPPLRKITLYAYIGKQGDDFSYVSQVGYYLGDDKQERFGGLKVTGADNHVELFPDESKYFKLDFSDRIGHRCYAKGTQYYADGKWCIANADNSITEIDTLYDGSNPDTLIGWKNILQAGGYFMQKFEFIIPAGIYNFYLGRHNVASSSDYRNTSTYSWGIANSRTRTAMDAGIVAIRTNAINGTKNKEMIIDCYAGDVDVWGNGNDLFYVYCPYITTQHNGAYRFLEGYFEESATNQIPIEQWFYTIDGSGTDAAGDYTDKNGFYWAHTKAANANTADIQFYDQINCSSQNFIIPTSGTGIGWFQNAIAYLTDHNAGQVGFGNYIVLNISIKNEDGTKGFSNIGVSIVNGTTVFTNSDGVAQMHVHNGLTIARQSNIVVNAGGNFSISLTDCGLIPLNNYNDNIVPCQTLQERVYPFPLNMNILVQENENESLKSNGTYIVGVVGADLAGRPTYVNRLPQITVPSFLDRDDILATFFEWAKSGMLNLPTDIAYFAFFVTTAIDYKRYLQWIGDTITFIDNNGNETVSPSNAALVKINIDSLLTANINQNFTLLANYQFVQGDRLRVYDNGEGQLLDTATYGAMIDVEILGSNYNQAAINANLIPPSTNTVLNNNNTIGDNPTTLFVRYDSRFDVLQNKTGFWIELFTPSENNKLRPYFQIGSWMPVINGEPAIFLGYDSNGNPNYSTPTTGVLEFWDTYLIHRNITTGKFIAHPFESPNVTDTWGANLNSGGKANTVNSEAKQMWYIDGTIKSDNFISEGLKNGLGTFRTENKKSFTGYWWGGIVMVKAVNSIVFFLCENDYFTTDYNFHYTYPSEQGVMVVNLDNGLSQPHQKIGDIYGCDYDNTSAIIVHDGFISWHDKKNSCYLISDYSRAKDITQIMDGDRKIGIKSYYSSKSEFVGRWNLSHDTKNKIDIVAGIDMQLNNIYITFRPRRDNTSNINSFVNQQRNIRLEQQETFVYSIDTARWLRTEIFTPECYAKLRGTLGNEMLTFAKSVPYYHINTPTNSWCNFYGVAGERIVICAFNDAIEISKILQSISMDSNNMKMLVDMIYSTEDNSFSYVPVNYWIKRNNLWYAQILRNANSYPPINKEESFRNMLFDGKLVLGVYFLLRFVGDPSRKEEYQELNNIYYKYLEIEQSKQK